jgi:putative heme-binding domain-containing protein
LATARAEGLPAFLQKTLGDRDLQLDAIRGLAAFHDPRTPRLLIERFNNLQPAAQREAINTLVSRSAYANVLLAAVAGNQLPRQHVSSFHLRQMNSLGDQKISEQIAQLWPELQQLSVEKSRRIAEFRDQLRPEQLSSANLSQGRAIYQRVCAACHVLFGQGGKVGPDLTGAQRHNLNYLLENIVDPSATVNENFRMSTVIIADGRVVNGVVSEKTDRTITVVTPNERLVLSTDEIEEVRPSNLSIMPEGQLDVLPSEQVRDLIAYLMAPSQVALPADFRNH